MTGPPIVNTHVHVPPNFSAFATPEDVIEAAAAEGVRAIGISNFYDQQVYRRFADAAAAAGIVALFGLEFITLDPELEAAGVRVNDPANPGRIYFCGKGIAPFKDRPSAAATTAAAIRRGNDERAHAMVGRLASWLDEQGVATGLTAESIAADVAERTSVPVAWVSLQERHIARAFAERLAGLTPTQRERVLGADVVGNGALQGEVRARLLKAGRPGFVPEVPLSFSDAYAYVLAMDGIPCYPVLADGTSPISPWEYPPGELAERLRERGVHAAELISNRNASALVDEYVEALTAAGLIVLGGTEHNTPERVPLQPVCSDGRLSERARTTFVEGTCVVAAHQHLVGRGEPGYVDATGALVGDDENRARLVSLGAELIGA